MDCQEDAAGYDCTLSEAAPARAKAVFMALVAGLRDAQPLWSWSQSSERSNFPMDVAGPVPHDTILYAGPAGRYAATIRSVRDAVVSESLEVRLHIGTEDGDIPAVPYRPGPSGACDRACESIRRMLAARTAFEKYIGSASVDRIAFPGMHCSVDPQDAPDPDADTNGMPPGAAVYSCNLIPWRGHKDAAGLSPEQRAQESVDAKRTLASLMHAIRAAEPAWNWSTGPVASDDAETSNSSVLRQTAFYVGPGRKNTITITIDTVPAEDALIELNLSVAGTDDHLPAWPIDAKEPILLGKYR